MKRLFRYFLLGIVIATLFCGCKEDIYNGNWIKVSTLSAKGRSASALFVIDNKAYILGGYGYYYVKTFFNTTWGFDAESNSWFEYDTIPCIPCRQGVGFSIDGKGYFCGGISKDDEFFADLYQFDPTKPFGSQWTKIDTDPYPGGEFYGGVGFSIGGYGYVGAGVNSRNGASNEYYRYDPTKPAGSRWSKVNAPNAAKRLGASCFVIGDRAYIVGGRHNNSRVQQFECYDASEDKWIVISENMLNDYNINLLYRYEASAFAIGNKGYITCGVKFTGEVLRDTWEYTPDVNGGKGAWQMIADFEGPNRHAAMSFATNNRGYVICGQNGVGPETFLDDIWQFDPNQKYNERFFK